MAGRNHHHKIGPWRRGELPTMRVVRAAAEAACRLTRMNPDHVLGIVAHGFTKKSHGFVTVSRTRVYVTFALRAIFEDGQPSRIAEMLRVRDPGQWLSNKDVEMRQGKFHWWSDDLFMAVIEATEAFIAMEKEDMKIARAHVDRIKQEAAE